MTTVCFCVTNDVLTDQRVKRHATALVERDMRVTIVGRMKKQSQKLSADLFSVRRFRLPFERGPLFYATYNIRLFFFLLRSDFDLVIANDADTLLACYYASKWKKFRWVYDSHEFFTGVPELHAKPMVRRVWCAIERKAIPKVHARVTVNGSIADLLKRTYGYDFSVVRNVSNTRIPSKPRSRAELGLPENVPIVILQGAWMNVDRGAEEAVEAFRFIPDALLLVIGGGDVFPLLKEKVRNDPSLQKNVRILDMMPANDLVHYTCHASLGLSLDKDTNLNYRYSLPNKLFDYIQCGVPVLATPMVEVKNIVETYQIGELAYDLEPERLAGQIRAMIFDRKQQIKWKQGLVKASAELRWDHEKNTWKEVIAHALKGD
ncbi:MAG: glycosyltransferase family 4 protein [Flavobacteriales bacterium]|nr:glycosyltransferase family 4 protein [Flavobacteriales bacterium]